MSADVDHSFLNLKSIDVGRTSRSAFGPLADSFVWAHLPLGVPNFCLARPSVFLSDTSPRLPRHITISSECA